MDNKKLWAIHNSKNGHWLYIWASSFDKALAFARTKEPGYNGGMVIDKPEHRAMVRASYVTD